MIENIKIKNFKGIEDLNVNFLQKNISATMSQKDQFVKSYNGDFYSLIPTFLARNGAGKTSLIRAIEYISKFSNFDAVKEMLTSYIRKSLRKYLDASFMQQINENTSMDNDIDEKIKYQLASEFIFEIYNDNIFSRKDFMSIELKTVNKHKMSFISSPIDFNVNINGIKFSLKNIFVKVLSKINLKTLEKMLSPKNIDSFDEKLKTIIDKVMDKYAYPNVIDVESIYRTSNNTYDTNKVKKNLITIANEAGYGSLKNLLNKIDSNISGVEYNKEDETINVFFKSNPDFPADPETQLSFGTRKTLDIIATALPLFKKGGALLVDEIETGLHLSLVKLIVEMFCEEKLNISAAQLIITTHNPLLFERGIINVKNGYIHNGIEFIPLKNSKAIKRTEDLDLVVRPKNYYDDEFWIQNSETPMSSISDKNREEIISAFTNETNN